MTGSTEDGPVFDIGQGRTTTREGWRDLVCAKASQAPLRLTPARYAQLSAEERASYNWRRRHHHMNLPTLATPGIQLAMAEAMPIIEGNALMHRRAAKQGVAISGDPHVGKTVLIESIGRKFELAFRAEYPWGTRTSMGGLFTPIVMVDLAEKTRPVDFDKKILSFLHAPIARRATHSEISDAAMDHLVSCGTQLVIVDDIHELRMSQENGQQVNAKIKGIADATGVTFVVAGVDLKNAQFLNEGKGPAKQASAQTRRRFTLVNVGPYDTSTKTGLGEWKALLASVEAEIVLTHGTEGALTAHWEYLFQRTQGKIGTLVGLVQLATNKAIDDGSERLTEQLLSSIRINVAGEAESSDAPKRQRRSGRESA